MNREHFRTKLEAMENEELFGDDNWVAIVEKQIESLVDDYREALDDKHPDELFSEEALADMREKRIEARLGLFDDGNDPDQPIPLFNQLVNCTFDKYTTPQYILDAYLRAACVAARLHYDDEFLQDIFNRFISKHQEQWKGMSNA